MRSTHRTTTVVWVILALGISTLLAQTRPAFEVASVRPNLSGSASTTIRAAVASPVTATNITVRMLILTAYRVHRLRLVGGPDWIDRERFDIVAKQPPDTPTDQIPLLWQSLLEDRFKLRIRNELRPRPIYRLVRAHNDGTLGPQLARSTTDCAAVDAARRKGPIEVPAPGQRLPCNQRGSLMPDGQGIVSIAGRGMAVLAELLTLVAGQERMVVDRTGLSGGFDAELQWHDEPTRGISSVPPDQRLSVFTAIQEQLGLKLEPATEPIDVLVVESVDRPTPD
jgi:uncharacterized protein (TIGR03435 family)